METHGIHLDQFEDVEAFYKSLVPKIRSQPGVKRVEVSVCGTGRVGTYYEFTSLDAFKEYSGSKFREGIMSEFGSQPWYDDSKEPTEIVAVHQINI